jgi:hypothetical protein
MADMTDQEHEAERQRLRRLRADCVNDAQSVLPRLTRWASDYSELLSLAELKAVGAAEEVLRAIRKAPDE